MSYDIIGDIHGQHAKLVALLKALGYRHRAGAWRHPSRCALFAGDFVDGGPNQLETLRTVRAMIDAGSAEAILGNHEFNAMAFHAPDPCAPHQHLRLRNEKNRRQHARFLEEVEEDSAEHRAWIAWFYTLPLWIEKQDLRLVHACWHPTHMATLRPYLRHNHTLTPETVERASRAGSEAFTALEVLCKGLEVDLPGGVTFTDAEGHVRSRTRVRWWDASAETYRSGAMLSPAEADQLPATALPPEARVAYDNEKPLFFGHYWFTGTPGVLSPMLCCVDYSAARPGQPLVAYRWDGETHLSNDKLFAAGAAPIVLAHRSRPGR